MSNQPYKPAQVRNRFFIWFCIVLMIQVFLLPPARASEDLPGGASSQAGLANAATNGTEDPDEGVAPLAVIPVSQPELVVSIELEPEVPTIGEAVRVHLNLSNPGQALLEGHQVSMWLPQGVDYISGRFSAYDAESRLVAAWPEALGPGATQTVSFEVQIELEEGSSLTLAAVAGAVQLEAGARDELHLSVENEQLQPVPALEGSSSMSGPDPASEGGWTLQVNEPVVSTFSGAASYQYPVSVPPGRNGLQPAVNLSYNSRRVDGIINWQTSEWVGLGWNLSTIDIVRTNVRRESFCCDDFFINYDNRFQLIMNGTSYDLQPGTGSQLDGRYYADGAPDLYIQRINDCSDDGNCYNDSGGSQANKTTEYWLVKTPDGTTYRLGYNEESEQVLFRTLNLSDHPYLPVSPYSGPVPEYSAYRWRVDQVKDLYDNEMVYEYDEYTTSGSGQRDVASYITNIKYNNQGGSWLSNIEFAGQNVGSTPDALEWPIFTTRRNLIRISVWWESTLVNEYIFNMAHEYLPNSGLKITLTGISPYGLGGETGGHVLPGPSFGYTEYANKGWCLPAPGNGCYTEWDQEQFPYERLTSVDNGYGGRTEFDYAHEIDGRGDWWRGFWNYHVTEVRTFDGINDASGPVQVRNYDYGSPCYNQWGDNLPSNGSANCASPGAPENGSLVGYDVVTVTVGTTNQPLSISEHHYLHTEDDPNLHYALLGREALSKQYDADGITVFREASNTYGRNDTRCSNAGLPSSANFVCLQTTESTVYAPATGDSVTAKTEHYYDPSYQGGVQYGRRTRVSYYDTNNNLLRYTVQVFDANTTNWIITQRMSRLQNGSHDLLARTFYLYDGSLDPDNQTITTGELTLTRLQLSLNNVSPFPLDSVFYETVDTSYTYDGYGNLTTATQYEDYGEIGYIINSSDWSYWTDPATGNGRTTTTVYDGNNLLPVSVSNPLGHTIQTTNDASFAWLPASVTDVANGITTQYRYDEFGRLRKVIRPGASESDPTIQYTYFDDSSANGQTGGVTFTSPLLIATDYSNSTNKETSRVFYDGLGRLVQQQEVRSAIHGQAEGRDVLTSLAYDALGQTVCQTVPYDSAAYSWNGATPYQTTPCTSRTHTTTTYDVLGRVLTTEAPDGSHTAYIYRLDPATGYSRVNIIDANRHRIQHNYDQLGRLVVAYELTGNCGNYWATEGFGCDETFTEPWNVYATTLYAYDMQDNLKTVTDDAGNVTSMWYDFLGRKTSMSDPDMGEWSYTYDPAGNLVEQTDNKGQTITFTYDDLNRLDTKLNDGQVLADYTYDNCAYGIGRLCRVDDASGWHTYSFDYRGRLVQESRVIDDGDPFVMSYSYDALDRATAATYPNGETVTTEYNPQGLPITLTGSSPYVSDITYNGRGQMVDLFRGNGVNTTHHYYAATGTGGNSNFRLSRIDTDSLLDLGYEYDPVGNITRITDNLLPANKWQQFEYDDLNRLTRAWTPVNAVDAYDHTYDYNPIGNITSYDGVTYHYNDPDHVHAVTHLSNDYNFGYDANGNMTSRQDDLGTFSQNFDVENRLESVTETEEGTTTFVYDASGQRVQTIKADGTIIYTPYPGYDVELVPGPAELYVDSNHAGTEDGSMAFPFNTINEALEQAGLGTTIFVGEGTYPEQLIIPANVTVRGGHPETPGGIDWNTYDPWQYPSVVISGGSPNVRLAGTNAAVIGLRLESAAAIGNTGIYVNIEASNALISEVHVSGFVTGMNGDAAVTVERSVFANNQHGIRYGGSEVVTIRKNTFVSNTFGIYAQGNAVFEVQDNVIVHYVPNNGYGIGIYSGTPTVNASYNIVRSKGTNYHPNVNVGPGSLTDDPRLVNPSQGDYRLWSFSPAVGAASDGGQMGAFEDVVIPPPDVYVDGNYSGPEEGTANRPFNTINEAFALTVSGSTVHVGAGSYNEAFLIPAGVTIKGGYRFAGGGVDWGVRDPWQYPSVISGQIPIPNLSGYCTVCMSPGAAAVGLKLQGGGSGDKGLVIRQANNAVVREMHITGYTVGIFGFNNSTVEDSLVKDNTYGIWYQSTATANLYHNTIVDNTGAGVYAGEGSSANLTINARDNIIVDNGYGFRIYVGTPTINATYNDVWSNNVNYGSGVTAGTGSLSADPLFYDAANDIYRLWAASPAVGAASEGTQMGAFQEIMPHIYVDAAYNGGEQGTLAQPFNTIGEALSAASANVNIHVAEGSYDEGIVVPAGVTVNGGYKRNGSSVDWKINDPWQYRTSLTGLTDLDKGDGAEEATVWLVGAKASIDGLNLVGPNTNPAFGYEGINIGVTAYNASVSRTQIEGYAIAVYGQTSSTVDWSLVINNNQGIVYNNSAYAHITHNTIVDNAVAGVQAELYISQPITSEVFKEEVIVQDNIIIGNQYGILQGGSVVVSASYNDVWNNTLNYAGDVEPGKGAISVDPEFANVETGDYRLSNYSPAGNAASKGGPLGAFDYVVAPPTNLQAVYLDEGEPNGYVSLIWEPHAAPEGTTFNVYRSQELPVPVQPANLIAGDLFTGQFNDEEGSPGDYYIVTAVTEEGESRPSNSAQAQSSSCEVCGVGRGLEGNSDIIERVTYGLGGQTIAIRVSGHPVAENNGLFYLHRDHLGSTTTLSDASGNLVPGSLSRYLPFGDYRTESAINPDVTDRGFTGHKHNDDIGLIYMNARFYVPGIGRFASADTIVPNLANPQSYNRYTYVENRPLNFVDPTGHCKNAGADPDGNPLYECMAEDGTLHQVNSSSVLYTTWYSRMEALWEQLSEAAEGSFGDFLSWALDGGLFFYETSPSDFAQMSGGNHMMGFSPLFLFEEGAPQFTAYRNGEVIYHLWSVGITDFWGSADGFSLLLPLADLSAAQKETFYNFMYNAIATDAVASNSGVRFWTKDVSSGINALAGLADKWTAKGGVELAVSVASIIPQYISNAQEWFQRTVIADVHLNHSEYGLGMSGFIMTYRADFVWQGFSPYANTAH